MTKVEPGEYRCAACGTVYKKGLSDAETEEQYKQEFPNEERLADEDMALICDPCFKNGYGDWRMDGEDDE